MSLEQINGSECTTGPASRRGSVTSNRRLGSAPQSMSHEAEIASLKLKLSAQEGELLVALDDKRRLEGLLEQKTLALGHTHSDLRDEQFRSRALSRAADEMRSQVAAIVAVSDQRVWPSLIRKLHQSCQLPSTMDTGLSTSAAAELSLNCRHLSHRVASAQANSAQAKESRRKAMAQRTQENTWLIENINELRMRNRELEETIVKSSYSAPAESPKAKRPPPSRESGGAQVVTGRPAPGSTAWARVHFLTDDLRAKDARIVELESQLREARGERPDTSTDSRRLMKWGEFK